MLIDPFIIATPFVNTKSLLFDGVDDYVTMGNPTELQITGALSISFWFKSPSNATGDNDMAIIKDDLVNRCFAIWTNDFGGIKTIGFHIFSSGTTSVQSSISYNDGNWHHVMCVFIPSTSMKIYVDGVNDGSNTTSIPATIPNDPADFNLGTTNGSYMFEGNLDEVAIWNTDQTANVATIYNSGTPTDLASLSPVGWWRNGDGDTYPTITDHGSGGNDGTMTNMTSGDIVTDTP